MIYTIIVNASPHSSESAHTAYQFTVAALNEGHLIKCVFFYCNGTLNGSAAISAHEPSPVNLPSAWLKLYHDYAVELHLCSGSAAKTGVIDEQQARRLNIGSGTIASGFVISGLGTLTEAMVMSDRVVTFGSAS